LRCLRDDTFSRFDRTPACNRQTDRQTDRHRATAYSMGPLRLHSVAQVIIASKLYGSDKQKQKPGIERVQALADISRSRYIAIAMQPVHRLHIRTIVHNWRAPLPSGVAGPLAAWCCGQICRPIVLGFGKWIACLKPRILMPKVTCSIYSILVSS